MNALLAKFQSICSQPYQTAREWKEQTNGKVIGCLPMYFPEEFIHACGALPVTLFASNEPITLGNRHMMTNACDQVRSTFDSLLKNKYDFLDGLAAIHVCDQVKFFLEVWQLDHPFSFFHQMLRPYRLDDTNRPFLISELKRLKGSLESFTEQEITTSTLHNSIKVYNESRSMMRRLNDLRAKYPGIISASAMVSVVTSSMLIPREEHNEFLFKFLADFEQARVDGGNGTKVVLIGHPCAMPEENLLNMIEEQGLFIVDDDLFTGARYFEADVKEGGDPIQAFADYYMKPVPCTTHHFPNNWIHGPDQYAYGNYVCDKVGKAHASAVIILREMYCDPFDLEFVLLKERLETENIPYLVLFTEHGSGPLESIRTRIQAFKETLR